MTEQLNYQSPNRRQLTALWITLGVLLGHIVASYAAHLAVFLYLKKKLEGRVTVTEGWILKTPYEIFDDLVHGVYKVPQSLIILTYLVPLVLIVWGSVTMGRKREHR